MSEDPANAPHPPRSPAAGWIIQAIHLAIAMAAVDVLIHLYHGPNTLRLIEYVIPPALTMAGIAGLLLLLLGYPFARVVGLQPCSPAARRGVTALCAGGALTALQWFEANPYLYSELPRWLTFGNLVLALAGHVRLSRTAGEDGGKTRWVILTGLAYLAGAINLAAWFYLDRMEEAWGSQRVAQVQAGVSVVGALAFLQITGCLLGLAARAIEARARLNTLATLVLLPLPYALLAAAGVLWRIGAGTHAEITPLIRELTWAMPAIFMLSVATARRSRERPGIRLPALLTCALLAFGGAVYFHDPLLAGIGLESYRSEDRAQRHLILVSSDTLRTDVLEPYGSDNPTPYLRALAEDSIVFEEPLAPAPWTLPSIAAIHTGLAPGVFGPIGLSWKMDRATVTLAERLSGAGYYTGAIGQNALLLPRHGIHQGFQHYDFYPRPRRTRTLGSKLLNRMCPAYFKETASTKELARKTVGWMQRHADRDFFFWIHFYDPHSPLHPPEEFLPLMERPRTIELPWSHGKEIQSGRKRTDPTEREYLRGLYRGEVRYVDAAVGEIVEGLKALGLYDDALIVFTSDHGEELWDRGDFGHGQSLFHELIRVPLMVKLPGQSRTGAVRQPVWTVSLTPTFLDWAGIEFDPAEFSAPSIKPLLVDPAADLQTLPLFSRTSEDYPLPHQIGVRFDNWMAMRHPAGTSSSELYDLENDPRQKINVRAAHPEVMDEALRLIRTHEEHNILLRSLHGLGTGGNAGLSPEDLDALRNLGYLQ